VPREDAVMGRIVEILQCDASTEAVVILEQFTIQPERYELFNMPFLRPKRREEAVFLILKPTVQSFSSTFYFAIKADGFSFVILNRIFSSASTFSMTAHPVHANHLGRDQWSRSDKKLNFRSLLSNMTP
jgi:hypothetical protein